MFLFYSFELLKKLQMKTKLNPYLNFNGTCEEAFNFYKSVFGGDFKGGIMKMKDIEGMEIAEADLERVMHVALPIGDELLMGSDVPSGMGASFKAGNSTYISIFPKAGERPTGFSMPFQQEERLRCPWRICSGATISAAFVTGMASSG